MLRYLLWSLLLVAGQFESGVAVPSSINWKQASMSEVLLMHLEPSGLDSDETYLFLCRAFYDNSYWVPGKLHFHPKVNRGCLIPVDGKEHLFESFQVLVAPRGTTSWVPFNGDLPHNAIPGGSFVSGETTYICRVSHNDLLINGKFGFETCFYGTGLEEHEQTSNFEILVANELAAAIDLM